MTGNFELKTGLTSNIYTNKMLKKDHQISAIFGGVGGVSCIYVPFFAVKRKIFKNPIFVKKFREFKFLKMVLGSPKYVLVIYEEENKRNF
jgi:hypothetical protein